MAVTARRTISATPAAPHVRLFRGQYSSSQASFSLGPLGLAPWPSRQTSPRDRARRAPAHTRTTHSHYTAQCMRQKFFQY